MDRKTPSMSESSTPRYPNRLITTASPYLLQHAYNPVDWLPWGEEALAKAKREDKPILVSIGYSTCHWCHVMERESFEDEAVADFMNRHFINIKVDREERPDLDQLYMEAVQMIAGNGGWPLNCFLTPDTRPFYGGTYFPPRPAYNRPSWLQVLQHLVGLFRDKRSVVEEQADKLTRAIRENQTRFFQLEAPVGDQQEGFHRVHAEQVFKGLWADRDVTHGGLGPAPKFPRTMSLEYLLAYSHYTGQPQGQDHVHVSLQKMIRGGIYDQVGGGFARYATDPAWIIPHFEKMLYDNALLIDLLSKTHRVQPQTEFRSAVEETIRFLDRELRSPHGVYYAALDADSEGEEGKFYVWSQKEFTAVVGEDVDRWTTYLSVTPEGNWEGKNILCRSLSPAEHAEAWGIGMEEWQVRWAEVQERLLRHRETRVRPGRDDKVILGWNALLADGLLTAASTFHSKDWEDRAFSLLSTLESLLKREDGRYHRIYAGDRAYQPAFLEDYAFLIRAFLHALTVRFTMDRLAEIIVLTDRVIDDLYDSSTGAFRTTAEGELAANLFDAYDNAIPSGNSIMIDNLMRLYALTDRTDYREIAEKLLQRISPAVQKYPGTFAQYAQALLDEAYGRREIVLAGKEADQLLPEILEWYLPGTLVIAADEENGLPLLKNRVPDRGTQLYLCRDRACQMPVTTVSALWDQL